MTKVYSLDEARDFFLRNATEHCLCILGDASVVATCYPDAVAFYKGELHR